MLLFLSLLGIALSIIILYSNARENKSSIYLGVFFLLISLYTFYQYVILYSKSAVLIKILLVGFIVVFPPVYLIGPMLFLYIRSVLTDDHSFRKIDHLHLIPMAIFFLASIPYLFVPMAEKAEVAAETARNAGFVAIYSATSLIGLIPVSAMYLIRPILVLAYTIWSIVLFSRYLLHKRIASVFTRQKFMAKWLFVLLSLVLILSVSQIIQIARAFEMGFSDNFFSMDILRMISILGLVGLMISPLFFPAILYGLPRVPNHVQKTERQKAINSSVTLSEKRISVHFETRYLETIEEKTEEFMEESQPYLEPNFNLAELSANIQVPMHHLGYYFREYKKESFSEYRNRWRVEYAKSLIMGGKTDELTLEAIALSSGFSNRNSFRSAFQKIEGTQPSAFVSQVKE
jgi:AraC-like DNA-binding protein